MTTLSFVSTATLAIVKTVGALVLLLFLVDTLRNIWLNFGSSYPVWSTLVAAAIGAALWWIFGTVVWLSTPRSSGTTAVASTQLADEREWPPLSDKQITEWSDALRPYKITEIDVFWSPEVEAKKFFLSFKGVGQRIGVTVVTGIGKGNDGEIEIETSANDPVGPILHGLFKKANYPVKLSQSRDDKHPEILISIGDK